MAICSNCGNEVADDAKFCGVCGTPMMKEEPKAEAPASSVDTSAEQTEAADTAAGAAGAAAAAAGKTSAQTTTPYNYRNNYEEPASGIRQSIREFAGSPLFLFYIILTIASLIFSFLNGGASGAVGTVIFYIPTILCLIGMILGFADARSEDGPVGKGIGIYKAGKVVSIVYVVVISVFVILALLFSTFLVTSRPEFFDEIGKYLPAEASQTISSVLAMIGEYKEAVQIIAVVIIVFIVIFIVLAIFYFKSLMNAASAIRSSLSAGKRTGHVSLYPAVIRIITAVFAVPGCISMFANMSANRAQILSVLNSMDLGIDLDNAAVNTSFALLPAISSTLATIALIVGIILIFKLRRRINRS